MIGYKGIELYRGILRAKSNGTGVGDIFEIGVPKQIVDIDGGIAFSENGYSFCGTIEAVLEWRNYLIENKYRNVSVDIRLFEIDTLDSSIVRENHHYKAKQIVVNREITSEEIIQYFKKHPECLPSEEKRRDFDKYCMDQPQPYKLIKEKDEIKKLMLKSCFSFGQKSLCVQDEASADMDKCEMCPRKNQIRHVFNDLRDYWCCESHSMTYN